MTTHQRITTTAAVILALAGTGVPAASARPADDPAIAAKRAPASVYSRPNKSLTPVTTPYGGRTSTTASAPPAVVRIQTPQSGFDWGDAGIGAAGGIALAMLGLAGAVVISHHRPRRSRHTAATLPG